MNPLLAFLLLLLGVAGAYGTLYATDKLEAPWLDRLLDRQVEAAEPDVVRVLVPSRPLLPGSAVTREDVWDAQARWFFTVPIPRPQVEANPHWLQDWSKIEGRVLAREKPPLKVFTEADFLPLGTRPGPQSLVPEGKRYMAVSEDAIAGLSDLGFGDRFDLVAVRKVPEKVMAAAREAMAIVGEGRIEEQLRFQLQSGSVVLETPLVTGGLVVRPVAHAGDARRGKGREAGLAIAPEETSPLRTAIERGETIYCMPRSNLAGAEESMAPTGLSIEEQLEWLLEQVHRVTFIQGDRQHVKTIHRGTARATD